MDLLFSTSDAIKRYLTSVGKFMYTFCNPSGANKLSRTDEQITKPNIRFLFVND